MYIYHTRAYLNGSYSHKHIIDKSEKFISPPRKSKKFNRRPFISGFICPETPSFDLPTPNFAGRFAGSSGFRARKGELKGSDV